MQTLHEEASCWDSTVSCEPKRRREWKVCVLGCDVKLKKCHGVARQWVLMEDHGVQKTCWPCGQARRIERDLEKGVHYCILLPFKDHGVQCCLGKSVLQVAWVWRTPHTAGCKKGGHHRSWYHYKPSIQCLNLQLSGHVFWWLACHTNVYSLPTCGEWVVLFLPLRCSWNKAQAVGRCLKDMCQLSWVLMWWHM